jgi:hypothetical protein
MHTDSQHLQRLDKKILIMPSIEYGRNKIHIGLSPANWSISGTPLAW